MDLLALSGSFAAIIGLTADFAAHRSSRATDDLAEFERYLAERRHDDLLQLMNRNNEVALAVKMLLNQNHAQLRASIEKLDQAMAAFASRIDDLAPLAIAMRPQSSLSKQAIDILRQYRAAGASRVLQSQQLSGGPTYLFLDGRSARLEIEEPQFVRDDIVRLCELGLLRVDYNTQGSPIYVFTRDAAAMLDQIDSASASLPSDPTAADQA